MTTQEEARVALERRFERVRAEQERLFAEQIRLGHEWADLKALAAFVEALASAEPGASAPEPEPNPGFLYDFHDEFTQWRSESKIDPRFNVQDMYRTARDMPAGPYQQGVNSAKTHPAGRPQFAILEVTEQAPALAPREASPRRAGAVGKVVRFVVDPRDMDKVIVENEHLGITGSGIKCKIMKDPRVTHDVFEFHDGDIVETGIRAFIPSDTNPWALSHRGASPRLLGSGSLKLRADGRGGDNCDMRLSTDGPGNTFSLNRRNFDHGPSFNIAGGPKDLAKGRPGYEPVEPPVDRWFDLRLRYRVGNTPTNRIAPIDKTSGASWMEILLDGKVVLAANCGTRGFVSHPINQGEFGLTHTGAAGELFVDHYFIRGYPGQ